MWVAQYTNLKPQRNIIYVLQVPTKLSFFMEPRKLVPTNINKSTEIHFVVMGYWFNLLKSFKKETPTPLKDLMTSISLFSHDK